MPDPRSRTTTPGIGLPNCPSSNGNLHGPTAVLRIPAIAGMVHENVPNDLCAQSKELEPPFTTNPIRL